MANVFTSVLGSIGNAAKNIGNWNDPNLKNYLQGQTTNYATPYLQNKMKAAGGTIGPAETALINKTNAGANASNDFSSAYKGMTPQQQSTYSKANPNINTSTGLTQKPVATTEPQKDNSSVPTATPLSAATKGLQDIGTGSAGAGANTGLYQQWLSQQATNTTPAASSIGGLQGIAQNQTPAVTNAQNQYNQFAQSSPALLADVRNNPNVAAEISTGRGAQLGQILSGEQQALAQNVTNALAGQGQQITAGSQAGTLGLAGQQQQLGAGEAAANLGLTQQGQQIGALGGAAGASAPVTGPGGVLYQPQSVGPVPQGGNTTFSGGQAGAQVDQGKQYQSNDATLQTVEGQNGNGGMVGDFNSALKQSGLNTGDINVLNSFLQALSSNSSGQYPALQTQFNNVLAQYAKILGPQQISTLLASSKGQTLSQFFNTLSGQAEQVQKGLKGAGTSSPSSAGTSQGNTMFGSFFSR